VAVAAAAALAEGSAVALACCSPALPVLLLLLLLMRPVGVGLGVWLLSARCAASEKSRSLSGMPASTSIRGLPPMSKLPRSTTRRRAGDSNLRAWAGLRLGVLLGEGGLARVLLPLFGDCCCELSCCEAAAAATPAVVVVLGSVSSVAALGACCCCCCWACCLCVAAAMASLAIRCSSACAPGRRSGMPLKTSGWDSLLGKEGRRKAQR
jgi:hypothetical protein